MANDLRIVDAPEIPSEEFTSEVKIPTGGKGNYSVTAEQISEFVKVNKDLTDKDYVDTASNGVKQLLENHKNDKANPHVVTKAQVGLGNVNNTADLDKPVSNATNSAIITAIQYKADKTYVDTQLGLKTDKTYVDYQDSLKANKSDLGTASEYDVEDLPVTQKQRGDFVGHVNTIADLTEIRNAKAGQIMYVKSIDKNYTYTPSTTEAENGVTVVGKWVMEIPDAYYASWFADPDSTESQALKLQLGSDYATSKNRAFIVDKVFWADGRATDCNLPQGDRAAFLVRTKSKTVFLPQAEIKILPNAYSNYHGIIACNDVSDYVLIKPKVTGDRLTHDYSGGGSQEWGYGITIYESSNGVLIRPKAVNTTGDGIYVGKAWNSMLATSPRNIIIDKPFVDYTRRNGISITACEGLDINNPVVDHIGDFNGITGAFPKACIDIEPENGVGKAKSEIIGLRIHNPTLQNSDAGFLAYASLNSDSTGRKFEVSVTGNAVIRNIRATGSGIFIHPATIGFLNISSLQFTTAPAVSLVSSVGVSTTFSATIAEFHYVGGVFHSIIDRFQGTNSNIGNLLIENVINRFDKWCPVLIDTNSDRVLTINNLQVYVKDKTQVGVTTYTDDPSIQASLGGKRNYLESLDSFIYESWSTSSKAMPNEIWQNPSVDNAGETPIYINVSSDYRVLKIGLFQQTATIGQGCNINGLNLTIEGVSKTQAQTLTLGGWIKFQNVSGGRTKILDHYGVWTFS